MYVFLLLWVINFFLRQTEFQLNPSAEMLGVIPHRKIFEVGYDTVGDFVHNGVAG